MENRWGRACVRALEIVIVACLAVMAVLVFGNVVLRYAFDSGRFFWAPSWRRNSARTSVLTHWSSACRWPAANSWCC